MPKRLRAYFRYPLLFVVTLGALLGLLAASGSIPRAAIEENASRSSEYFLEHELFPYVAEGLAPTMVDNYADCILFNIIYCIDVEAPLRSALRAEYYRNPLQNENVNFAEALAGREANFSYSRYWHGSMVWLRPLLTIWDIEGIRVFHAVVMAALAAALCFVLGRRGLWVSMAALLAAMAACFAFIVPLSIEYTTTFLLALIGSLLILRLERRGDGQVYSLMLVLGMATCFVDFLTTETLPALLPLTLAVLARYRAGRLRSFREEALFLLRALVAFGAAYALMWVVKWGLASLASGENAFETALSSALERVGGETAPGGMNQVVGALIRNLSCIFPLCFARTYGGVLGVLLGIGVLAICPLYLFRRDMAEKRDVLRLLLLIPLVTLLRYLALNNHSFLHYFFTFRAQIAPLTALLAAGILCLIPKKGKGKGGRR